MTTPQDIIRAWCASFGMAEPSNGDCGALLSDLFPALSVAQALGEVLVAREQEPRGKRSLAGFMYRHAVDIASKEKHANGWVRGPWQLTFDIEGAKRHPHSGVWPGFEFFPLYRDLSDEVRNDTALASRSEAPEDTELLVSAYRIAATLQGEQSLVVMELANRFARLAGKSAEKSEALTCTHEWVSARNPVITSGEICIKCYALRAEQAPTGDAQ